MKTFEEEFDLIKQIYHRQELLEDAVRTNDKPIVIFGCGSVGKRIYNKLYSIGVKIAAFCDNDNNKTWNEIPIIDPQNLNKNYPDSLIIISSHTYKMEIKDQLIKLGFADTQIRYGLILLSLDDWCMPDVSLFVFEEKFLEGYKFIYNHVDDISKKIIVERIKLYLRIDTFDFGTEAHILGGHYFDNGIIDLGEDETYIDGGVYDGDTIEEFITCTKGKYKNIIGFELLPENYEKAKRRFIDLPNIEIINKALYSHTGKANYVVTKESMDNHIVENGESILFTKTITIDDFLYGKNFQPTFIKMDIQGAEYAALMGAKNLIVNKKPKCSICVYHKIDDIYRIPELLLEYNKDYKFYIRHYSQFYWETVLFAR